jgi:hypothetical protein
VVSGPGPSPSDADNGDRAHHECSGAAGWLCHGGGCRSVSGGDQRDVGGGSTCLRVWPSGGAVAAAQGSRGMSPTEDKSDARGGNIARRGRRAR